MKNRPTKNSLSFLRWAGSKQRLLPHLEMYFNMSYNQFHEPFLGGGNIFLNLVDFRKTSYLSDLNADLINCFNCIKSNPLGVIEELKKYKNTKEEYLKERNKDYSSDILSAAKFIYINRTCYNGIYRVNSNGFFNVPYGYRQNVDLVTENKILNVSKQLTNATLEFGDFNSSLKNVKYGDLVFLDPPYTVAHQNNGFVEYNQKIFHWEDQIALKEYVIKIVERGAFYILTNASHDSIIELYRDVANPIVLERYSLIGGNGSKRGKVNELLFTNIV